MSLHTIDVEQGSEEWHAARRGIVTASVVGQLVSVRRLTASEVDCPACGALGGDQCVGKTGPIKSNHPPRARAARESAPVITAADNVETRALAVALAADRLTDWTDEQYESRDMLRGHLDEPLARDHYSEHHSPAVECGFMVEDSWGYPLGYSPDGLVGDDGLIEIKSRAPKKHVSTVLANEVPAENMAQIQAGLLVSGRAWCDYLSWSGGMPMYPIRVYPDPAWFAAIVAAVQSVEVAIRDIVATYRERVDGLPPTEHIDHFPTEPEMEF